jgi:SAM-dependent methyltransferase
VFLVKTSPAYLGGTMEFLASPAIVDTYEGLTATVRRGTITPDANTVAGHEQDHWVRFARAMVPLMMPSAIAIADLLQIATAGPVRILDIAAGHGIFGIVLAQKNPRAEVTALDWPGVLTVASENAVKMGVKDRHRLLPGDAFNVEYGTGYDIALLTNFLHHYDVATCTGLLRKIATALKPGGRIAILEFVPNADRVSPPIPAAFSLSMLAGTPAGDAYTFTELKRMATSAGFTAVSSHPLPPTPATVVMATR